MDPPLLGDGGDRERRGGPRVGRATGPRREHQAHLAARAVPRDPPQQLRHQRMGQTGFGYEYDVITLGTSLLSQTPVGSLPSLTR